MFNAEDREKVRELHARYAHTIDEGRFEDWAACFTDDGIFETKALGRFVGREALVAMARDFRVALKGAQQRHIIDNVGFQLDGDAGVGTCNLSHYITRDGVTELNGVGVYHDQLRRVGGEWYFASRIVVFDTDQGAEVT
jgi:3-phenylpropionate/cinnamic acid dioxygenase small subunit